MILLELDPRFDATQSTLALICLVLSTLIGIVPATLAAIWSRSSKKNSIEANENSAGALHEVRANGGMSDPDPTLKDYIKFVGENVENNTRNINKITEILQEHLEHSKFMDAALAEVFLAVRPKIDDDSL